MSTKQPIRCPWVDLSKPDYVAYHDEEWGVPVTDDQLMFEFLTLESAQAGLSWYTVLKKRHHYRRAFANFEVAKVARFTPAKIEKLLANPGLIRNRLKIQAAVSNARLFIDVAEQWGTFCNYLWHFVDYQPVVNAPAQLSDYLATSAVSDRLSRELKQQGFKFVGSTIMYAHLQAAGLINDHAKGCYRRTQISKQYPQLKRRLKSLSAGQ